MTKADTFRVFDNEARAIAQGLVRDATYAALAVARGEAGPSVSRIALATDANGHPISLISDLSAHTAALLQDPKCALLVGEPDDRGDPLTHPRLSLHCMAEPIARGSDMHQLIRARYLSLRPKAKLYIDFADFRFVRFRVIDGLMNGGFGKAYKLTPDDLIAQKDET